MHRRLLLAAALSATLPTAPARARPASSASAPAIAAASDLQFAIEEISARFRDETGEAVRLVLGSSGNLARQIEQGAPYQLFLSADESFVFRLADRGLTRDRGTLYAIGRIVAFAPRGSPLRVDPHLAGLREALAAGRILRFAIANPEHAPYGRAAAEALERAGLMEAIRPRLVLGENVAQAMQFATAAGAEGGILAYSLVLAPPMRDRGEWALLPPTEREALRQRMVLTRKAGPVAERFHAWMQTPEARDILHRHGFRLPGES